MRFRCRLVPGTWQRLRLIGHSSNLDWGVACWAIWEVMVRRPIYQYMAVVRPEHFFLCVSCTWAWRTEHCLARHADETWHGVTGEKRSTADSSMAIAKKKSVTRRLKMVSTNRKKGSSMCSSISSRSCHSPCGMFVASQFSSKANQKCSANSPTSATVHSLGSIAFPDCMKSKHSAVPWPCKTRPGSTFHA
jgi:hypothetical protein